MSGFYPRAVRVGFVVDKAELIKLLNKEENRWKKSKIGKGGERGILREARRGRELVTWKDAGRRMEVRINLTSGI